MEVQPRQAHQPRGMSVAGTTKGTTKEQSGGYEVSRSVPASTVYFVHIGRHVKIGYSTNLPQRLKAFATSTAEPIRLLATIPGGREEELRLHRLLAHSRLNRGEFFHFDARLEGFISRAESGDLPAAWQWLEDSDPARAAEVYAEQRRVRHTAARLKKAEIDAHYAKLVVERKRRLGW